MVSPTDGNYPLSITGFYAWLTPILVDPPAESQAPAAPTEAQKSETEKIKQAILENRAEDVEILLDSDQNSSLIETKFDHTFEEDPSEDDQEELTREGLTPLIFATILGHSKIVKILLDRQANALAKAKNDSLTRSILELALEGPGSQGDLSVAKIILESRDSQSLLELRNGTYEWTPLLQMSFNGNLDAVNLLLDHGAKFNATDVDKDTALHLAAMKGHHKIAEKLIEKDDSALERQDNSGDTPLHIGARCGKDEVVQLLLRKGAKPDVQNSDGNKSLHLAAKCNHCNIAEDLLNQADGVNLLEMQNNLGETPYLIAAKFEAKSAVRLLIKRGANPDAQDKFQNTALHLAASEGSLETVRLFVGKEESDQHNFRESVNNLGETPLLVAIQVGEEEVVNFLLENGANLEAKDVNGNSALHFAVSYPKTAINLLETLFAQKTTKEKLLEMRNNSGETPYLIAAKTTDDDAVNRLLKLLKHGANLNAQDYRGNTALHLAAMDGLEDIAEALLDEDSAATELLKVKNTSGETPYLIAAKSGEEDVARVLLEYGANSKECDNEGNTALHLAAKYGHLDFVKILKMPHGFSDEEGPAIESLKNKKEEIPLMLAAQARKLDVVEYLLSLNKDRVLGDILVPKETMKDDFLQSAKEGYLFLFQNLLEGSSDLLNEKDNSGKTALDLAVEAQQPGILDYLLTKNMDFNTNGMEQKDLFHECARKGYLQLIKKLFKDCDELIWSRDWYNETALLIASKNAHTAVVGCLCDAGADLEAKDLGGYTPLLNAVYSRSEATVQALLNRGASQAAITRRGRNALHMACSNRDILIVRALLNDRPDRVKKSISATDRVNNTPLCDAISSGEEGIIFELLRSQIYFPRSIVQDQPYFSPTRERDRVSQWLTSWIQRKEQEKSDKKKTDEGKDLNLNESLQHNRKDRIKSLICWAILNHNAGLLKLGMEEGGLSQLLDDNKDRNGATWLHLAALSGHCDIVDEIRRVVSAGPAERMDSRMEQESFSWEDCIEANAATGITPLHVAARMRHEQFVLHLLNHLALNEPDSQNQKKRLSEMIGDVGTERQRRVLEAIIHETDDEENLISFTVATTMQIRYSEIARNPNNDDGNQNARAFELLETELWRTVISIIQKNQIEFFKFLHSENAELFVKTIIWRDTVGIEDASPVVKDSLAKLEGSLHISDCTKWNHLEWAVQEKYPLAVYGLLSSERNFSELEIRLCEDIIETWDSKSETREEERIRELLRNTPPVRPRRNDHELPQFQNLILDEDKQKATVIDLSTDENQFAHTIKRETVYKITYVGPEKLMATNEVVSYKRPEG
ncbi:Mg2+ transporter protein CorA-like/Zinc transport protein ZntB [Penicillium herquei]|nr:Mg2+ transporter protein CorA-like/Zinc transport protein ZntB [Penicillium herquei]